MSTKISALNERVQSDIIGDEFFPIIDGGTGSTTATANYQTYKIRLDTLFASGQGHEKVTSLAVTDGETIGSNNTSFTLRYTDEAGTPNDITIAKYEIQNGDVDFEHINTSDLVTSTQRISVGNTSSNVKLVTAAAVDEHIIHKENLLFNNSDSTIKVYYGDSTTARDSGNHILRDFALNTEVADDFADLLDGVKPELNTFKKIEEEFDLTTIDRNTKIGTDQVNLNHFRIDNNDSTNRLNVKGGGIDTSLIADRAVTTDKIKDKAVLNFKIADEAVDTRTIIDNAVTTDKIINDAVTPAKLSPNGPEWDANNVYIPNSLNVVDDIVAHGNISQKGSTLSIYNSTSRGTGVIHQGRALAHSVGDRLHVNFANDYTGGVHIRGTVLVPDQTQDAIVAAPGSAIATKAYVDFADIRIRPLDASRIGDDAIINRHISPSAVNTLEIADDSITTFKIENIGPQWDQTGKVQVNGDLDVAGTTATIGTPGSKVDLILRARGGATGFAKITRNAGPSGDLLINNVRGSIKFGTTESNTDFTIAGTRATFDKGLTINGNLTSTINSGDISNGHLLLGTSSYGIGIDNNEIYQRGDNLNIGSLDAGSNIYFRIGTETIASFTSNGRFQTDGDIVSETGVFRRNGDTTNITLRGGTTDANGANIKLYGTNNALNANRAVHNAESHYFQNASGTAATLIIDAKSRKVQLLGEGVNANHLITKNYVDTKKIAPADLTTGGPEWDTTTVTIPDNLAVTDIATIGDNLSVGGQITQTGPDFKIFNPTRAGTGNTHSGRALVHGTGDKLTVNHQGDYTGGVEIRGKVIAPDQTTTIINSNNQALTTKKYVEDEIAKVYPDDNYVNVIGDNMTGDLTWNSQSGKGLAWSNDTDSASIKFYTDGDASVDNRLEFNIRDNSSEHFLFTHTNTNNVHRELLKVGVSEFKRGEYDIWHDGNTSLAVGSSQLANLAVTSGKIGNLQVTTGKLANSAVTGAKIADNTISEAKLSNVEPGFLLGRGHGMSKTSTSPNLVPIGTSVGSTHDNVPSGLAVRNYVAPFVTRIAALENAPDTGRLYHVNAVQKSRAYFLTTSSNNSSNVFPPDAVLTYAKQILPNLKAGDNVLVVWGYRSTTSSNGTSRSFDYATTAYRVTSSTSWYAIQHGTLV